MYCGPLECKMPILAAILGLLHNLVCWMQQIFPDVTFSLQDAARLCIARPPEQNRIGSRETLVNKRAARI